MYEFFRKNRVSTKSQIKSKYRKRGRVSARRGAETERGKTTPNPYYNSGRLQKEAGQTCLWLMPIQGPRPRTESYMRKRSKFLPRGRRFLNGNRGYKSEQRTTNISGIHYTKKESSSGSFSHFHSSKVTGYRLTPLTSRGKVAQSDFLTQVPRLPVPGNLHHFLY